MRQHGVDLLPESLRARSQAGVRFGRYLSSVFIGVAIVVLLTLHSRIGLQSARGELAMARSEADRVIETRDQIARMESDMEAIATLTERYRSIASPLDVSLVVASVINRMPKGVTLDRFDIDVGTRMTGDSPRARKRRREEREDQEPRVLQGELAGFAPDDAAIADFFDALKNLTPLQDVSLDFSRTRSVRDEMAREFRLSFRVDFEALYEVTETGGAPDVQ